MFLNTACYYSFDNGKKIEHVHYNFKESGDMVAEKRNYVDNSVEESVGKVDVSCNWENVPAFGDYSSVIRIDRV